LKTLAFISALHQSSAKVQKQLQIALRSMKAAYEAARITPMNTMNYQIIANFLALGMKSAYY
jgi:hypothetical protein